MSRPPRAGKNATYNLQVKLTDDEVEALDARKRPGEKRADTARRLMGLQTTVYSYSDLPGWAEAAEEVIVAGILPAGVVRATGRTTAALVPGRVDSRFVIRTCAFWLAEVATPAEREQLLAEWR